MAYMVAAYSVAWVVIFVYLFTIGMRQSKLIKEIEFIKELNKTKSGSGLHSPDALAAKARQF